MRRSISAPLAAMLALAPLAAATPWAHAQLFRRPPRPATAPVAPAAGADTPAAASGRGAHQLLRNGLDYLDKYGDAQRALTYLGEARRRQAELSAEQRRQLADAWQRAERVLAGVERPSTPIARRGAPSGAALVADRRLPALPADAPELGDALRADRPTADPAIRVAANDLDAPATVASEATPTPPDRPAPAPPLMLEPDAAPAPIALEATPEADPLEAPVPAVALDDLPPPPPSIPADPRVVPAAQPATVQEPVAATPLTLEEFDPPAAPDDEAAPADLPPPAPAPGVAAPVAATPLTLETFDAEPVGPTTDAPAAPAEEPAPAFEAPAPEPEPNLVATAPEAVEAAPAPEPDTGILLIPPPPRRSAEPALPVLPGALEPAEAQAAPPPAVTLPELPDDAGAAPLPAPPPELPRPAAPEVAAVPGDLPTLPAATPDDLAAAPPPAADELPRLPSEPSGRVGGALAPRGGLDDEFPRIQLHRPEAMREVEEIARRMNEEALRNPVVYPPPGQNEPEFGAQRLGSERNTALVPRAPSPTEARPIRAIPVPDAFVPLEERRFAPYRKYFAASANCNMPLYFQDAAVERYGQSVEQALGPHWGRFFSYPLDDPRQTTQRNQLLQPFYSTGLFALQIAALPYHMLVDPPWEAQYDLGFHRPGDPTPPDLIYWPKRGIGPPGHGRRY